jgi:hypothetical protein
MNVILLSAVLLSAATPAAPPAKHANDPLAIMILDRMADMIGSLHSCSFRLEVDQDAFDDDAGTMLKHHNAHDVWMVGPDKMLVNSNGDKGHRGFWYDGKIANYYDYQEHNYGRVAAPANIVTMIDSLHEAYAIDFPAADFFYPTFVTDLIAQSDRIVLRGTVEVDGRDCFHVLARGRDQDVQIWIANDATALPVKYVIRSREKDQTSEYSGLFRNWTLNPDLPTAMFSFMPPPGAREVRMLARNTRSGGRP